MDQLDKIILAGLMVPLKNVDLKSPEQFFGLPLLFTGHPGIGKSERLEGYQASLGMMVHTIHIPEKNQEDLAGYPVQDGKGRLIRMTDDELIVELSKIGEGIVFLDEINTPRQNLFATLLGVLLKRRLAGIPLGGKVRFMAARNPIESSTGGMDLTPPLANRFCFIPWGTPTPDQWNEWVTGKDENEDGDKFPTIIQLHKQLETNWGASWPTAMGRMVGFMNVRGSDLLHKLPAEGDPSFHGAWPSPRTWWWALRSSATCMALKSGEAVRIKLMGGCVGHAAITEYLAWEKAANLPTAEEMLTNGFPPDKRRLDRSMAAYTTLTAHVGLIKNRKEQIQVATRAWTLLHEGCEAGLSDIIAVPARTLLNAKLATTLTDDPGSEKCRAEAIKVLNRMKGLSAKAREAQEALEA